MKDCIVRERLPKHIAVIMDGNGRWAKQRGHERVFGHKNGVNAVRQVTEACAELGVEYLTLYTFSTENWNRPKEEIDALMSMLVTTIASEEKTLMELLESLDKSTVFVINPATECEFVNLSYYTDCFALAENIHEERIQKI